MAKSNEPIWWSMFSAGGMVSAFFTPVLVVITGIIVPFGLAGGAFSYERIGGALGNPLVKIVLFGLIALPLFHFAHRLRFTLVDVGFRKLDMPIAVICYATAIAGTAAAAVLLWRL